MNRISSGISDNCYFRRPRFRINSHDATTQALRCGDENVARPGHHINRHQWIICLLVTISHESYCLSTADRPHFIHTEKPTCGKNRRVRPSTTFFLRRRSNDERADPRFLRRHNVHDDTRRINSLATGDVQPHAPDWDEFFSHHAALGDGNNVIAGLNRSVDTPNALNGVF